MSLQQDESLPDDPREIAVLLVKENGLKGARQIAVDGTTAANERGNFYRLSIWREVKSILAGWKEAPDSGP
jgi:hypothetical protein